MRSKVIDDRVILECACMTPDHLMVVDVLDTEQLKLDVPKGMGDKYVYGADFYFISDWHAPWYKRVWYALKYIFKKQPYCVSDCVFLTDKNVECLQELVDTLKKQRFGSNV